MLNNIIYVLATSSLLTGSILTFDKELPDYFYLIGTSLFFIKSSLCLIKDCNKSKKKHYTVLL